MVEIQDDTNLPTLSKASAPYQIHADCVGLSQFIYRLFLNNLWPAFPS